MDCAGHLKGDILVHFYLILIRGWLLPFKQPSPFSYKDSYSNTYTIRLHNYNPADDMSTRSIPMNGVWGSLPIEEDLINDAEAIIPMVGLKTPQSLRARFAARLGRLLDAELNFVEDVDQHKMVISVTLPANNRPQERQDDIRPLLSRLQVHLRSIALTGQGNAKKKNAYIITILMLPGVSQREVCASLWDELLIYSYPTRKKIIDEIRQVQQDHREHLDNFITSMFRINDIDAGSSAVDEELGAKLIDFYHGIQGYNGSMKQTHDLIQFASSMACTILHLQERIKGLLKKARFANSMYRLICWLGFPERVHKTLVRAANSSVAFQNITFELRTLAATASFVPSSHPQGSSKAASLAGNAISTPGARSGGNGMPQGAARKSMPLQPKPNSPVRPSLPGPVQENAEYGLHYKSMTATISAQSNHIDPLEVIQPFLSREDRSLGLLRLQPRSKQMAAHLAATALCGKLLPVGSEAWYNFGFVVTKDEAEERHLINLYAALLKNSRHPEAIFMELVGAIETGSLVDWFDRKEYAHFRHAFHHLEHFLNTQPHKRPTVWRLKQFVHSDAATEPPACLQRDYGFKLCRNRDEVDRIKSVYATMLRTMDPLAIHGFCLVNRLHEEGVVKTGIPMDARDARLMKNDYPSPFVGFDDRRGLDRYCGPFFKRSLKA